MTTKQNRKNLIKERAVAMQTSKTELASMQAEAEALEAAGKWDEATIAWGAVVDYVTGAKDKKRAAGKQAAAKVRASAASKSLEEQIDAQAERAESERQAQAAQEKAERAALAESQDDESAACAPEEMAAEAASESTKPAKAERAAKPAPASKERDPRLPSAGTILVKKDRAGAERARCTVLEKGIEYAGETYKTLSAAGLKAMADLGLTASTCDGFVFWGLKKSERAATAPKEAKDTVKGLLALACGLLHRFGFLAVSEAEVSALIVRIEAVLPAEKTTANHETEKTAQ